MTIRYFAAALVGLLLTASSAGAQSAGELLQKGIYTQETLGDLDGAIRIYRELTASSTAPKSVAAQAQYQLVLSMLQKGDRAAAASELDLLTRNFSDQPELVDKARKLIPGASTLLAPPWGKGEASQLNIKRNGQFTGEYLYYSATPYQATIDARQPPGDREKSLMYLEWNLVTKTSTRGIKTPVEPETLRRAGNVQAFNDDETGDPSAAPFAGPAIDAEPLVFRMRMLPLAVGYKTTVTTLPFFLGKGVPRAAELAVTAVEPVQTVAGQFRCYKVVFASLGQTFWFGVDGARPLVKFQSGEVEAELVKRWGPSTFEDALAFLWKAGWQGNLRYSLQEGTAAASTPMKAVSIVPFFAQLAIDIWRLYTPPSEIEQDLRQSCADLVKERHGDNEFRIRPGSMVLRTVGGYQSVGCIFDYKGGSDYFAWIRTEGLILRFHIGQDIGVFRWVFDPLLDTIQLPKE